MSEGKARFMIGSLALFPEACVLALQGVVELNAKGLADSRFETCLHWECVLVKMPVGHDLVPAAVLCFTHDAPRALLWVQLSYVAEQFRGRGVYKAAYAALRQIAQHRTCRSIEGATHVKNTAMRTVAKRMGRREEFVILVDDIEIVPNEVEAE